jgi:hypothetical protein
MVTNPVTAVLFLSQKNSVTICYSVINALGDSSSFLSAFRPTSEVRLVFLFYMDPR